MHKPRPSVRRICPKSRQRGQGMTEYLILVALVSIVSIAIVKTMGKTIIRKYHQMSQQIEQKVDTEPYNVQDLNK